MKILITGDLGFVGRHFKNYLKGKKHKIDTCDIKRRKSDDCRTLFKECDVQYDLVIHLAAVVGGRETIDNEPLKVATDLAIDSDFFQFVARTKPHCSMYFSSSAAYPAYLQESSSSKPMWESLIDPMVGNMIGRPDQTYGWAKLTGEMQAEILRQEGHRVMVFRPFSGYGHDQDDSYPFPAILKRVLAGADPITVWGNGYQKRDWVHIDDVVRVAMEAYDQGFLGTTNIATGVGTTFVDLARKMANAAGRPKARIQTLPDKPSGVFARVGDPTQCRQFVPDLITIDEGISRSIDILTR